MSAEQEWKGIEAEVTWHASGLFQTRELGHTVSYLNAEAWKSGVLFDLQTVQASKIGYGFYKLPYNFILKICSFFSIEKIFFSYYCAFN